MNYDLWPRIYTCEVCGARTNASLHCVPPTRGDHLDVKRLCLQATTYRLRGDVQQACEALREAACIATEIGDHREAAALRATIMEIEDRETP